MTSTEVSSVWRQYGTAQIERMQQEVDDADMAEELIINELKQSAERRHAVHEEAIATALQTKAHTQAEELIINERKQLKQSEETLTTKELKQSDKTLITKEGSHKKQEETLIPKELKQHEHELKQTSV